MRFSVETPLRLHQFECCFDEKQGMTGLLTWAFLHDPLHQRFLVGETPLLHPGEWNEGLHVWQIHMSYVGRLPPLPLRTRVRLLTKEHGRMWFSCGRAVTLGSRADVTDERPASVDGRIKILAR